MKTILLFLFSVVVAVNLFAQPAISSFSPGTGTIGSSVTITGSNFNTTAAQNIVFFGATQSMVTAATGGSLTVTVPLGASYQYLSVTNLATGLTAYSANPFIVTYLSGSINFLPKADFATGVNPNSVSIGDIDGDGKPDLIVVNSTDNTVSVLRNTSLAPNVSFAAKVNFITGNKPYSICIGDIDGDGKPDLVVANRNSASVSVLRNTSTSSVINFATQIDFATGLKPVAISIGDINGDGKPDLAVANNGNNTASILRNTSTAGMISFAVKVDFASGFKPVSINIGDIDGDGKPDVAVANNGSNTVSILRNTSTSTVVGFAAKVDLGTGSKPSSLSIGDIDKDGKPDVVVANINSNSVSVLRNTSTMGVVSFALKVDFTTGSGPNSVSIGDIDGDGKPDLAIANLHESTVTVLRNISVSGMISFVAPVNYASGSYPVSVSIGDLNGDGQPDLALANDSSNVVSVMLQPCIVPSINSATFMGQTQIIGGTFAPITVTATGSLITYQWYQNTSNSNIGGTSLNSGYGAQTNSYTPQAAVVGTLYYYCVVTGICGLPESTAVSGSFIVNPTSLIPTISSFTPSSGAIGSSVTISGSNFNTTAAQNIVFFGATQATVTAVTSGSLTVTVPQGATYQYISITNLGTSLTAYSAKPFNVTLSGSINFIPKNDFATGLSPSSVSIGDLDGDGKSDLAVSNPASTTVSVFRNTSTAGVISFANKVDFTTSYYPVRISIGDLNGDGKPDLVVAYLSGNTVSVLLNTSTAGIVNFATKMDFATGNVPASVSIGDLDGDGKPDLAVANINSKTISVLLNTSTAGIISFATKMDFATGNLPINLSIGDLDGDGKPDLSVANYSDNTLSIFRNTSTAGVISFATKMDFATGNNPSSISIGDIDGDGKLDLSVANYGDTTASVLINTSTAGVINFATKKDLVTSNSPANISIGDLDGDGKPDLAVVNAASNTVSIFHNTSTAGVISFATKMEITTGVYPVSVSIGDLDGDGKPDLAVVNSSDNSVSVILQSSARLAREGTLNAMRNYTVAPAGEHGFTINPNPVVSTFISVQLKNQPAGKYILRFINTIGQPVFTGILQHSGGNSTQTVNLPAGIAKGTYQAELHGINGTFSSQTIIVNTKK